MVKPESCQTAGMTVKAIPQGWGVECHRLIRESRPSDLEDQVDPGDAVAGGRVHQPAPHHARSDKGDRHGEQEDAAEEGFALQFLVQQDRQPQPDDQAARIKTDREHAVLRTSIIKRGSLLNNSVYCVRPTQV